MLCFHNDDDSLGVKNLVDGVRDLRGQAFLNLGTTRVAFDDTCELRQASDLATARNITDVCPTVEREQVVFADRVEGDVANQDKFVRSRLKLSTQVVARVFFQARKHFTPCACHPVRSSRQTFARRVLTDRNQQVSRRFFHAGCVVRHQFSPA
ncbi:Uncharacterised protein [Chlamydia trachomatis]|nr:Uncharacterised protein [Chlamydia trachomatis]